MADFNNTSSSSDMTCFSHSPVRHSSCYMIPVSCVVIIFTVILLINLVGNSIVVIVIISQKRMQTFTNWLILNLAFADLSVALFCIPLEIPIEIKSRWIYGRFLCSVLYPLQSSTIYASVLTLVLLSLSRFYALLYPFKKQPRTYAAKVFIVLIWFVSILLVLPYMFSLKYDEEDNHCKESWSSSQGRWYTIITFIFQYVLPLTIITIAYTVIIYDIVVKKNPSASYADKQKDRENKKLTKLLVIFTVTFALCLLPYHVVALLIEFNSLMSYVYFQDVCLAAYVVLYVNSAINPVLYNVFRSSFRRGFALKTVKYFNRKSEQKIDLIIVKPNC